MANYLSSLGVPLGPLRDPPLLRVKHLSICHSFQILKFCHIALSQLSLSHKMSRTTVTLSQFPCSRASHEQHVTDDSNMIMRELESYDHSSLQVANPLLVPTVRRSAIMPSNRKKCIMCSTSLHAMLSSSHRSRVRNAQQLGAACCRAYTSSIRNHGWHCLA